jgi:hypothetical protein
VKTLLNRAGPGKAAETTKKCGASYHKLISFYKTCFQTTFQKVYLPF